MLNVIEPVAEKVIRSFCGATVEKLAVPATLAPLCVKVHAWDAEVDVAYDSGSVTFSDHGVPTIDSEIGFTVTVNELIFVMTGDERV